jgi:hypothetical protein
LPIPTDPSASTLVRRPDRWHKQASRAGVARRPAPNPGPPSGHLEDSPWRTGHGRSQAGRPLRQGAAAGHPPGQPGSADQFLLRTPGSGWPGGGHGGPLERPVGRTSQFNVTAQPMGTDPVRTAAAKRRTPPAPSVRPCVWPAGHGQPRGVHVLALTGQDSNAHAPFGQPQQLPASGPVRRDHLHPMLDAGTSASLVPVRCPRGRVRRPRWTPRSDRLRTPPAPSYPAGHRPLHPARHGKPEATRTGNRRTAPKAFGHPRSPPPQGGPPGHAEPPPVGPAFAAWQPRLARRWQDCQHDRNHGSDQAATWCRSTVQAAPRRTALLRRFSGRA